MNSMIDAHHHFWNYDASEFDWIEDDMAAIRRDFAPAELKTAMESAGVEAVVSVQARQILEETHDLLELARQSEWILGVVGWVPLMSEQIERVLAELRTETKLKGVRHVVQAEPDGFLETPVFNRGIACLERFNLVYDLLISEHQLTQAIRFVDEHPDQPFVLDHIAKPRIKAEEFEPWVTHIHELARRPNVTCKISGMVTEADFEAWTPEGLRPYFETVLGAFGPSRLMFGSDWPVCLVACDYARWAQTVRDWAAPLSQSEQNDLFFNTAKRAYNLD